MFAATLRDANVSYTEILLSDDECPQDSLIWFSILDAELP